MIFICFPFGFFFFFVWICYISLCIKNKSLDFFPQYSHLVYSFEGHSKVKFKLRIFSLLLRWLWCYNSKHFEQLKYAHTQLICIVFYYIQRFICSVISKQNFYLWSILATAYSRPLKSILLFKLYWYVW